MPTVRQFLVIGLGRFGAHVALGLFRKGHEVIALDPDPVRVDLVKEETTTAIIADATHHEVLDRLPVANVDAAVVAIGRDIEASILVTALLKDLGCANIIARAASDLHANILERVGATRVVYPEDDVAERIVRGLTSPHLLDLVELAGDLDLGVLDVPGVFVGKSLRELALRTRYGVTLVALRRGEDVGASIMIPGPDEQLQRGDRLYLVGDRGAIARVDELE